MGRPKKYLTEEERKAARKETRKKCEEKHKEVYKIIRKKWKDEHKDRVKELRKIFEDKNPNYNIQWYNNNKESQIKWRQDYRTTPLGRAIMLLSAYKQSDRKKGRGETDLTPSWIVENIFTKSCVHCGETDWTKIGCNRLDNSKPHTIDNVEPCCEECNKNLWYNRNQNNTIKI